jgi:hypothetical protein
MFSLLVHLLNLTSLDSSYIEKCPFKQRACVNLLNGKYSKYFRAVYGGKDFGYHIYEIANID